MNFWQRKESSYKTEYGCWKRGCTCMGFEKRAVAFLDVLGFKGLVENAEAQPRAFVQFESLITVIEDHVRWDNASLSLEVPPDAAPKYLFISDSIILSAPLVHDKYDGMVTITLKAIAIAQKLLEMGVLVRGGIAVGNVRHELFNIFGTGYNSAYQAEQEAKHPRIMLTKEAASRINTAMQITTPLSELGLWLEDAGDTIVDILHPSHISGLHNYGHQEDVFVKYRSYIVNTLEQLQPGCAARGKWEWMAGFLNQSIKRHSISVPPIKAFPFPSVIPMEVI